MIQKKSEAHYTLSIIFNCYGVPLKMVVENSKEESLVEFACKCREDECLLVNNEPICPGLIFSEGCIWELKHDWSREIIKKGSPKRLWYHCIYL